MHLRICLLIGCLYTFVLACVRDNDDCDGDDGDYGYDNDDAADDNNDNYNDDNYS